MARTLLLSHDSFNEYWRIEILEQGSVITLIGSVPSKEDLETAETIVKQQEGVLSIVNELDIEASPESDDFQGNQIKILPPRR